MASAHTYQSEIVEEKEEEEEEEEEEEKGNNNSSEIYEINERVVLAPIKEEEEGSSLLSLEERDGVYVAVGKSKSSMDALCWTLTHFVNTSNTILYLIHVFPEIRHIPSPLGMLPKSQVSPAQVENYMAQERGKRTQLLQKFLDICSASKVKVDTMLIESDMVAKAILDLVPILNITKLVVGTSNSNPRKLTSRRGIGGIANQILQGAPNSCEVKVVCEGKEVITQQMIGSPSPSPRGNEDQFNALREADDGHKDSFACICLPKFK